jgi:hypothetical protein
MNAQTVRTGIFVSYSHQDKKAFKSLMDHLAPLQRDGHSVWTDQDIVPGQRWHDEISQALARAHVAILLVTPSFIASPYVSNYELPRLLEAAETEGLRIFWIPWDAATTSAIDRFQAAHPPAQPLATLGRAKRNQAMVAIVDKLRVALGSSTPLTALRTEDGETLRLSAGALPGRASNIYEGSGRLDGTPAVAAGHGDDANRSLPPLSTAKGSEAWATVARVRQEPDAEFSRALRAHSTERTLIVRRPTAAVTDVTTLVNTSRETQGSCRFGLFSDSPSQFKDLALCSSAEIGGVEFEPSISLLTMERGLKFIVEFGFKGHVVEPGARITLRYSARYPWSVALNDDYWVFPAEKMSADARLTFVVKFPVEPADISCYRITPDDRKEHVPVSGPVREHQEDPPEDLIVYRVAPEHASGNIFVMTWRLENEQ